MKAKEFLQSRGKGSGSNFTVEGVAELMEAYAEFTEATNKIQYWKGERDILLKEIERLKNNQNGKET